MFKAWLVAASIMITTSGCGDTAITEADKKAIAPLISQSQDYSAHQEEFNTAAATLVKKGTCTPAELKNVGGWWKSVSHKPKPVYFTYCGGMTVANRIYIDTSTREIFK